MTDDRERRRAAEGARSPDAAGAEQLADPGRRRLLARLGSATVIAAASGLGSYYLYDPQRPVRSRREPDRRIPDRRVKRPATAPKMVIARGGDPARNVQAALARIGGIEQFVGKGETVLVKPNVGWDRRPEHGADTDPQVVGAVVRACREAGARRVIVSDCPVNNAESSFAHSGIAAATRAAGGVVVLPSQSRYVMVRIPGKLGRWPVLEPYVTVDKVINVPIAKHHSLTRATVGMKNWYGILGGQRNRLHQRIDDSVAELAALMLPTLTVVDATRLLLRNGPTGGNVNDVKRGDALAVSVDPVAADAWAVEQLGAAPGEQGWLRLAQRKHLGVIDYRSLGPIEIKVG